MGEFLVFNRGIIRDAQSHSVALEPPSGLVQLTSYCLNPNHYHLLLKQTVNGGISKYMHKLMMGYSQYFNKRRNRSGSLFQGKFKAVEIKTGWQLLYVSAYINGNPEIHGIAKADKWKWSSYRDYLGIRKGTLCNKNSILEEYKNIGEYRKYVAETIENSKVVKEEFRKYSLE